MMVTNLANVLRAAGLKVQEISGWETRGHGELIAVEAIVCHHTAGPKTGNYPSLNTVKNGRSDLAGPLSQLGLARDGTWIVIAAGVAYHAGATFEQWQNNWHALGIEAEGTGVDAWPAVQYDSYVRGVRALTKAFDVPVSRVLGHKEVAKPKGRKTDPNFDMADFRAAVARSSQPTPEDWFTMATPAEIENAVKAGVLAALFEYGRAFFKDEAGTGDTIMDESRAHYAAVESTLSAIAANTKPAAKS